MRCRQLWGYRYFYALIIANRLEDTAAHEDAVDTQLHAQGSVGRRGHAASREVHHRELARLLHVLDLRFWALPSGNIAPNAASKLSG